MGERFVLIIERRIRNEGGGVIMHLVGEFYPNVKPIELTMDNLNTRDIVSLYLSLAKEKV